MNLNEYEHLKACSNEAIIVGPTSSKNVGRWWLEFKLT
jgi:hypothetical protein